MPRRIRRCVPNLVPLGSAVDSFPKHLNLWPTKTPRNAPVLLWGELYLAYVHSQTNPPTCTKVGANRSSRLTASPDFWMFDPLRPPSASLCLEGQFVWYPFPDEYAHVCQIWWQSVQPFDSFNRLLNLWPHKTTKMPPRILRGKLYLAYVHSQTNPQTCTKFGANQSSCLTAFPDFWICDPPKNPWCIEGRIVFSLFPFSDESADLYQIWCQSVSRLTASPNIWICDPLKKTEMPLGYCGANCI